MPHMVGCDLQPPTTLPPSCCAPIKAKLIKPQLIASAGGDREKGGSKGGCTIIHWHSLTIFNVKCSAGGHSSIYMFQSYRHVAQVQRSQKEVSEPCFGLLLWSILYLISKNLQSKVVRDDGKCRMSRGEPFPLQMTCKGMNCAQLPISPNKVVSLGGGVQASALQRLAETIVPLLPPLQSSDMQACLYLL